MFKVYTKRLTLVVFMQQKPTNIVHIKYSQGRYMKVHVAASGLRPEQVAVAWIHMWLYDLSGGKYNYTTPIFPSYISLSAKQGQNVEYWMIEPSWGSVFEKEPMRILCFAGAIQYNWMGTFSQKSPRDQSVINTSLMAWGYHGMCYLSLITLYITCITLYQTQFFDVVHTSPKFMSGLGQL